MCFLRSEVVAKREAILKGAMVSQVRVIGSEEEAVFHVGGFLTLVECLFDKKMGGEFEEEFDQIFRGDMFGMMKVKGGFAKQNNIEVI